jgi:hypothetical protein
VARIIVNHQGALLFAKRAANVCSWLLYPPAAYLRLVRRCILKTAPAVLCLDERELATRNERKNSYTTAGMGERC